MEDLAAAISNLTAAISNLNVGSRGGSDSRGRWYWDDGTWWWGQWHDGEWWWWSSESSWVSHRSWTASPELVHGSAPAVGDDMPLKRQRRE